MSRPVSWGVRQGGHLTRAFCPWFRTEVAGVARLPFMTNGHHQRRTLVTRATRVPMTLANGVSHKRHNLGVTSIKTSRSFFWSKRKHYSLVRPGKVSPLRIVPDHIPRPGYALDPTTFDYGTMKGKGECKTEEQVEGVRRACRAARKVLDETAQHILPGKTTDELDALAHECCISQGAYPSPLLYRGFPKSICTSVNNVACHGIPDSRPLEDGDIINIDVTVFYGGYHGDLSETYLVGLGSEDAALLLVRVTEECRDAAIAECGPGVPLHVIGTAVQAHAEEHNFQVVPHFCGHGIGRDFHGPPEIIHYVNDEPHVMQTGMTFTIEPILSEGDWDIELLSDGWTAVTKDGSRTAQCEHTILITEDGAEVLTAKQA